MHVGVRRGAHGARSVTGGREHPREARVVHVAFHAQARRLARRGSRIGADEALGWLLEHNKRVGSGGGA